MGGTGRKNPCFWTKPLNMPGRFPSPTPQQDPATEYEYRHEGVNDYITAPVNIPELIRQVLFFVE